MRISTQSSNDETVAGSKAFGFERTPEAFQLLSSTLYSNKPKAIIRELSCNALDAHIASGKADTPFEVKIPNSLDSQFYVKDFGPGLSHEQVLTLYTSYFKSTKQNSDEFIGGFGVGSKSPFAYTDSFTVESRHDGKKRIYSAFLNDAGIPEMSLMMEVDSDEPTGLTVGFPVRSADFQAFAKEAQAVFDVFPTKPDVHGMVLQPLERGSAILQTDKFTLRAQPRNDISRASIIMGAVEYPLEKYKDHLHGPASVWQKFLVNSNVQITVPVGSLSVAVSREDLAYDDKTLKALPDLLKEALREALLSFDNKAAWTPSKLVEVQSFFNAVGDEDLSRLLKLFPEKEVASARNNLMGISAFNDLPAVEVVIIDQHALLQIGSVPRQRFGMPKEQYALLDHATKYPTTPALKNHWQSLQYNRNRVSRDSIECITIDLPIDALRGRMLALDILGPYATEEKSVALLIPQNDAARGSFPEQAKETLARWGLDATDMTKQWGDAYLEYTSLQSKVPGAGSSAVKAHKSSNAKVTNWCVPVQLGDITEDKLEYVAKQIKKGSNEKAKSWLPLPAIHPRFVTGNVLYIEYDGKSAKYSGMSRKELFHLLLSAQSDLGLHNMDIVIVPQGSPDINRANWQPFTTAWLDAFKNLKLAVMADGKLYVLAKINEAMEKQWASAWTGHPAHELFAELPRTSELHNPSWALNDALQVVEKVLKTSFSTNAYDTAIENLESNYPLLALLVQDSNTKNPAFEFPAQSAQHLLEYIVGKAILNDTSMNY